MGRDSLGNSEDARLIAFERTMSSPDWAAMAMIGLPAALLTIAGTLLWMFQGYSATFVGLLNSLSSLLAGVAATVVFSVLFGGRFPGFVQWGSVFLILIAFVLLTRAERHRDEGKAV